VVNRKPDNPMGEKRGYAPPFDAARLATGAECSERATAHPSITAKVLTAGISATT
jgi:hypothetical protein